MVLKNNLLVSCVESDIIVVSSCVAEVYEIWNQLNYYNNLPELKKTL